MLRLARSALAVVGLYSAADARQDDPFGLDEQPAGIRSAAPGLARIAVGAAWRTTEWTVGTYVKTTGRVVRAAATGESPGELLQDIGSDIREQARRVLGVTEIEDRIRSVVGDRVVPTRGSAVSTDPDGNADLRAAGSALLSQSADVAYDEPAHPAYIRILADLAPDEGRILRLLATEGAQPAVDVRTGRPLNIGSELIAPGISMIGNEAGCRYVERVPAYLNNLYRLGLVWFSREPIKERLRYQVLEAQPDVLAAMKKASRGKTVRRSIHLTPFGADFCEICLPLETAEIDALPRDLDAPDQPEAATRGV